MKSIEIKKELYSENTIFKAVADYKAIARIVMVKKKNTVKLTFIKCKYAEDITIKEFENYLIGLENL